MWGCVYAYIVVANPKCVKDIRGKKIDKYK